VLKDGSTAGASSARSTSPRVIAASSRDVLQEVATGRLRRDLMDTFAGLRIEVRPLRRRPDEIVSLARALVAQWPHTTPNGTSIAPEAQEILVAWPWPENVTELVSVLRFIKPAPVVTRRALLEAIASSPRRHEHGATFSADEMERERAIWALARSRSINQAARTLRVQARTLQKKLRIWGTGENSRLPRHATTRWPPCPSLSR
jgi:DNA-binding NtrC family response regulator